MEGLGLQIAITSKQSPNTDFTNAINKQQGIGLYNTLNSQDTEKLTMMQIHKIKII